MNKHFNKQWLFWLAFAGAIALFITAALRVLTPEPPVVPTSPLVTRNIDNSTSTFTNVTFTGSPIEVPRQLPIVQVSDAPSSVEDVRTSIINEYNLKPVEGALQLWTSDSYYLSYSPDVKEYVFGPQITTLVESPPVVTKEQAITQTNSFVAKHFSTLNITPVEHNLEYMTVDAHADRVEPEHAEAIEVPYTYMINNYPVFLDNTNVFPFTVLATADEILKATFQPLFKQFTPSFDTPTISLDQAITNINAGQGSIIYAFQEESAETNLSTITSGQMSAVSLEYRYDSSLNAAYPFYRFSGEIVNSDGLTISAFIITPAIKTESIGR